MAKHNRMLFPVVTSVVKMHCSLISLTKLEQSIEATMAITFQTFYAFIKQSECRIAACVCIFTFISTESMKVF